MNDETEEGGTFVVGGGRVVVTECNCNWKNESGGRGNEQFVGGTWSLLMDGQEVEHAPLARGKGGNAKHNDKHIKFCIAGTKN